MPVGRKPKLAVWKFASCDGCQLSLLDCEDELLAVAQQVQIAYFPEGFRKVLKGPYDLSLIEGSIKRPMTQNAFIGFGGFLRRLLPSALARQPVVFKPSGTSGTFGNSHASFTQTRNISTPLGSQRPYPITFEWTMSFADVLSVKST